MASTARWTLLMKVHNGENMKFQYGAIEGTDVANTEELSRGVRIFKPFVDSWTGCRDTHFIEAPRMKYA
jgi:hypothetical protein